MKLTRENLHPHNHCGHTRKQLELLGVAWPPEKGWLSKLIGSTIPDERYAQFVALSKAGKKKAKEPRAPQPDLFASESPEDFANDIYQKNRMEFTEQ